MPGNVPLTGPRLTGPIQVLRQLVGRPKPFRFTHLPTGGTISTAGQKGARWARNVSLPAADNTVATTVRPFDPVDSSQLTPPHLIQLLHQVRHIQRQDEGPIVISHGTDTMIQTAVLLSLRCPRSPVNQGSGHVFLTGVLAPENSDAVFSRLTRSLGDLTQHLPQGVYCCVDSPDTRQVQVFLGSSLRKIATSHIHYSGLTGLKVATLHDQHTCYTPNVGQILALQDLGATAELDQYQTEIGHVGIIALDPTLSPEVLLALLEHGCDPNSEGDGWHQNGIILASRQPLSEAQNDAVSEWATQNQIPVVIRSIQTELVGQNTPYVLTSDIRHGHIQSVWAKLIASLPLPIDRIRAVMQANLGDMVTDNSKIDLRFNTETATVLPHIGLQPRLLQSLCRTYADRRITLVTFGDGNLPIYVDQHELVHHVRQALDARQFQVDSTGPLSPPQWVGIAKNRLDPAAYLGCLRNLSPNLRVLSDTAQSGTMFRPLNPFGQPASDHYLPGMLLKDTLNLSTPS